MRQWTGPALAPVMASFAMCMQLESNVIETPDKFADQLGKYTQRSEAFECFSKIKGDFYLEVSFFL